MTNSKRKADSTDKSFEEARLKLVNSEEKSSDSVYYRVKSHPELYELGQKYFKDFEAGIKSFAIASTHYQTGQEKTILGLASYFDHIDSNLSILIISNNLNQGVFQPIRTKCEDIAFEFDFTDKTLPVHKFHNHFHFCEYRSLFKYALPEESTVEFEEVLKEIVGYYDVIFWDVPNLKNFKEHPKLYFPIANIFGSLSLVVSRKSTTKQDIDDIISFFSSYGADTKGLIFNK